MARPEAPGGRDGRVQSVDRAAALLRAVAAAAPQGAPVAALASSTGINRATAWRLLATLEDNGLVERDDTGRYLPGPAVAVLAATVGADAVVRRAHPELVRLCELTAETVDLAMPRPGLTYVDEVSPPSVVSANWLGRAVPMHATSSGKAWLAFLPQSEAAAALAGPLPAHTGATITDPAALRAELDAIGRRGWAACRGEFEEQLYGVSAPVVVAGRPVAVLSVWGPRDRMSDDRLAELGPQVLEAAARIAAGLSASPVKEGK